jgi:hypothetical protein
MPLQQQQEATLTPDELQAVMRDAIARAGRAQRQAEDGPMVQNLATVEDALSIARDLDIPEEHVLEAVRNRNLAKLREQRREGARTARKARFFMWLAAAGAFSAAAVGLGLLGGIPWFLLFPTLACWIGAVYLGWKWLFAPVTEAELEGQDAIPVAGTCRVCGAPAYNERATFCEEHRYKGPTS